LECQPYNHRVGKALLGRKGNMVVGAIDSRDIVAEARRIHQTSPTATALLGRLLTGAALYSLTYHDAEPDLITFEIISDGPAGHAVAQVKGRRLRGYVKNPQAHADPRDGKLAVSSIVGKGILRVVRDGYVSEVPLVSGEIGEDMAHFFYQSEQRRTAVGVGVLVGEYGEVVSAGGFIVEALPDATEDEIKALEELLQDFSVSRFLSERGVDELFRRFAGDSPPLAREEYRYDCWCNYEELRRLVLMLEDRPEGGKVVARCLFCRKEYVIDLS